MYVCTRKMEVDYSRAANFTFKIFSPFSLFIYYRSNGNEQKKCMKNEK